MARPKKLSTLESIFSQLKEAIRAEVIADLSVILGKVQGNTTRATKVADDIVPKKPRKKMSAAGRAKIAAAQRARWAKQKAAGK